MINFHVTGNFNRTEKFLLKSKFLPVLWKKVMKKYAEQGLAALRELTPKESGITAESWSYKLYRTAIVFENSSRTDNANIAPLVILLQYGHATRTGGYVEPIDFINPALRPIFDKISIECWQEVERL